MSDDRRGLGNRRGPLWQLLRWSYSRWIQILAHFDLLGCDGKPSQGKLAAAIAMLYGVWRAADTVVILALAAGFGRGTLIAAIKSWRGSTESIDTRSRSDVRMTIEQVDARRRVGGLEFEATP